VVSRGCVVVAARSMGIWERKKTMREKAGAARERKEGVEAAHGDGEKLWSRSQFHILQKYCSTTKTVILNL
jgi:hypothetical protein